MPKTIDITNNRFGSLVALKRVDSLTTYSRPRVSWLCICDCGSSKTFTADSLRAGLVMSCGCQKAERCRELGKSRLKHGHYVSRRSSPTMNTWKKMLSRCTDKQSSQYAWYGARGITVDERWHSFENFLEDMGERPSGRTLDRIDNDGPYTKSNCRWATPKEQSANRRPRNQG